MFAITNDHSSHKGRGQSWWKIFFRAIFNIHEDDDDDDDDDDERIFFWQSAWEASSIPTMFEYLFTFPRPPCKRFSRQYV